MIRKAVKNDLKRLTEIYNQAIISKKATADMEVFTENQRMQWFLTHSNNERTSIYVYEEEGTLVGYCYLSAYRPGRQALESVAEISYYIDYSYHRRGFGSKLVHHDHMKAAGFDGFERGKVGSTAQHLSAIEYKTMIRQEELVEKEKALADADKQLAQKENQVAKLTEKEKDIQERIKSIEDSGQMLTLKQIKKIQTRVRAPLVGMPGIILSAEDEKNLGTTAIAAAKATEEATKYKNIARVAVETIRNIIQAVGLLKYNFKCDAQPVNNLTPEQDILIAAIRKRGIEVSRSYGYNKLADGMKKATMGKPMSEIFYGLEKEYHDKNKPSFLEAATQKAREYNEQNKNAPKINRERKDYGEAL